MGRRRQLLIASAIGAAVLMAVVVIAVVSGGSGHGSRINAAAVPSTSTPTTIPPDTTLVLEPVSDPAPTAPPPSAPATTSTTTLGSPLSGEGAVLAAPATPQTRVMHGAAGCASLGDGTGWSIQCGQFTASAIWLTETRSGTQGTATRAYLLVAGAAGSNNAVSSSTASNGTASNGPGQNPTTSAPGAGTTNPPTTSTTRPAVSTTTSLVPGDSLWTVTLAESDDVGGRFSSVAATTGSVRGDGTEAVLFGFHQGGPASVISLDLVEVPPAVTAAAVSVHLDLTKGSARVSTGQLDTWAASYISGDANCCPSAYTHQIIHYQAGSWRVVGTARISPASVPPSQV